MNAGVAMVRLMKPLDYYRRKYGTWMYGLNKLYLMMEKQHNRGQGGCRTCMSQDECRPGRRVFFTESGPRKRGH